MRLSVLSSGSSGNATYIETEVGGLLVDAGLSCRRIEGLLARIGRSLNDVGAVLLTHGHADHTSGVRSLIRECGVGVFAAPGVGSSLDATMVARWITPLRRAGLRPFVAPRSDRRTLPSLEACLPLWEVWDVPRWQPGPGPPRVPPP